MRVIKTGLSSEELAWWAAVPTRIRPKFIRTNINTIECDWVYGRPPSSGREYYATLQLLWRTRIEPYDLRTVLGSGNIDLDTYAKRVAHDENGIRACDALREHVHELHTVEMTHGDASFSNVIMSYDGSRATLIDPGRNRGLCCRELDEAKMLQSYDGFEEVYRRILRPTDDPPFEVRRVHWLLLVTHYIRLLRHVPCRLSLEYANRRIHEILSMSL